MRRSVLVNVPSFSRLGLAGRTTSAREYVAKNRSSLLMLRLCILQILVRKIDPEFQFIELCVFKYRPPVPTKLLVIGLGWFPCPWLLY